MPPPTPPRETTEQCKARWERMLQPLVGRTIVAVRYMNAADLDAAMWDRAPVVLSLDDGTHIYPSSDDEGNDAGALMIAQSPAAKAAGLPDGAPVI